MIASLLVLIKHYWGDPRYQVRIKEIVDALSTGHYNYTPDAKGGFCGIAYIIDHEKETRARGDNYATTWTGNLGVDKMTSRCLHFFSNYIFEVDINYIKIIVSDFNTKNYDSENLETSTMLMGLERYLLIIKTFKNSLDVSNYSKTLLSSSELLAELNKTNYNKIIISQQNFAEFYKNKDLEGYSKFFNNNYLENR